MNNKLILGSALSLAALAVAIDHTRHRLPAPEPTQQGSVIIEDDGGSDSDMENPCGLGGSPCGL